MYIIVEKEQKRVLNVGNQLDYMSNGYPRLVEENIAFPTEMVDVFEVESVPENIINDRYFGTGKYCYTKENGFYEDTTWEAPDETNIYGIPDEIYHQIIDDYTMEMLEGDNK